MKNLSTTTNKKLLTRIKTARRLACSVQQLQWSDNFTSMCQLVTIIVTKQQHWSYYYLIAHTKIAISLVDTYSRHTIRKGKHLFLQAATLDPIRVIQVGAVLGQCQCDASFVTVKIQQCDEKMTRAWVFVSCIMRFHLQQLTSSSMDSAPILTFNTFYGF